MNSAQSPTESHFITQEPYYEPVGNEVALALTDDEDMIAAVNELIAALF